MYASIRLNKNISATLYYHRKKETLGVCECLGAVNFVKDLEDLSNKDKLHHFRRLMSLHESITYNVVHMSLNFHTSDRLSNEDMLTIAGRHMKLMHLEDQPYLVYRHHDSIHPHVHLVTTNIRHDGELLKHTQGDYYHAVNFCKKIENEYGLVVSGQKRKHEQSQGHAAKIRYKEMPVMESLSKVLEKVLSQYKYKNLEELNAVLQLYNVQISRGKEGSRLRQHRGLICQVIDADGHLVRGYVKASLFDSKPTLDRLEPRFVQHQRDAALEQHRQRVTAALAWNMADKNMDLSGLEKAMQGQRISMVWSRKKDNVFFVDHETKSVFDGRQLGPRYDAVALRSRLAPVREVKQVLQQRQRQGLRHGL